MTKIETIILDYYGTRKACAEDLKIDRVTLYRYLKRPTSMPMGVLKKLAKKTNTDPCELI
jgi:hypothetical protein